jgi:lysophospholipase L1-like esterase
MLAHNAKPTVSLKRLTVVITLMLLAVAGLAVNPNASAQSNQRWIATWGASPLAPATTGPSFNNQTVRNIVHTSIGGDSVRVRISNTFGTTSLAIGAAHVALRSTGANTVPGSDRTLAFSGAASIEIPPGALVLSDPVELEVRELSDLAVSIYLPGSAGQVTYHQEARSTNYISTTGDFSGATIFPIATTATSWFLLTDIEVDTSRVTSAIVTLGDSITDGTNSTLDANHRWPNFLAQRLIANHFKLAVVDEGISGNRLLHDVAGTNALARLDRDVLAQTGVQFVTVLLGINDIGFPHLPPAILAILPPGVDVSPITTEQLIEAHRQIIARAHERRLKIFGCTLTPFEGALYFSAEGETQREAVNNFVRNSNEYDGVIDFDAATRDPSHPTRFLPAYDSGDHLHPNDAGYQAMANAVDLNLFLPRH